MVDYFEKHLTGNLLLGLTQRRRNTAEVSSNSATAAAVSLADPTLIKGVGGKQNSITADWLEGGGGRI